MELTITEKILREHSDKESVVAGDFILANIDGCLANDITAPIAIDVFEKVIEGTEKGLYEGFANSRLVLVPDHFTPSKDIASAIQCEKLRDFAHKYNILNL